MKLIGSSLQLRAEIRRNNLEGIRREIDAGVDVRQPYRESEKRLHYFDFAASLPGTKLETFQLLLEAGASVQMETGELVGLAAEMGDFERLRFFASIGCSLTAPGVHGVTPIRCAARHPKPEMVRFLLDAGVPPGPIDNLAPKGSTAIGSALGSSAFDTVRLLLERGATNNDPYWPPILTAVVNRDLKGIDRYRNQVRGDDLGKYGSPIGVAVAMGDLTIADRLARYVDANELSANDRWRILFEALTKGSRATIEWAYEYLGRESIDPQELADAHSNAAYWGNVDTVQWLVDTHGPFVEGDEYVLEACTTPEIADFYIRQGVDENLHSHEENIWVQAIRLQSEPLLRYWVERGTNPELRTGDGATPLHWAVAFDDDVAIDILLAAGANPNAPGEDDIPPLYWAKSLQAAEKLIAHGARPNYYCELFGVTVRERLKRSHSVFARILK